MEPRNSTIDFAPFDPALGNLERVTITVQTGMTNLVRLTGDNPQHNPFALAMCDYTTQWRDSITAPGSTVIAPDHRLASGRIVDPDLGRGATAAYTVAPTGPAPAAMYTVDAADFSIYTGPGPIPFALTFDAELILGSVYQCSVQNVVTSRATLTVESEYTLVPSPSVAASLVLGGLLATRRRR